MARKKPFSALWHQRVRPTWLRERWTAACNEWQCSKTRGVGCNGSDSGRIVEIRGPGGGCGKRFRSGDAADADGWRGVMEKGELKSRPGVGGEM